MDVWLVMPSANLEMARRTLPAWRQQGYLILLMVDTMDYAKAVAPLADGVALARPYRGYPWAVNELCRMEQVRDSPVLVCAGDDMHPDPDRTAQQIAAEFVAHFPDTFGVMQPTGDGNRSELICGSPWMGGAFRERINQGRGPQWPEYSHFWADEELWNVTRSLGILWLRSDISQRHEHWTRTTRKRPPHMERWRDSWDRDKALFQKRKAENFPGSEPLNATASMASRTSSSGTSVTA